jgi:phage shock protein PspC (stress-responsive transcriptional regulator)
MSTNASGARRLYRSRTDKKIAGVCGGLARYWGVDPVIPRIVWLILLLGGVGLLAYLIAWIVIPQEPEPGAAA